MAVCASCPGPNPQTVSAPYFRLQARGTFVFAADSAALLSSSAAMQRHQSPARMRRARLRTAARVDEVPLEPLQLLLQLAPSAREQRRLPANCLLLTEETRRPCAWRSATSSSRLRTSSARSAARARVSSHSSTCRVRRQQDSRTAPDSRSTRIRSNTAVACARPQPKADLASQTSSVRCVASSARRRSCSANAARRTQSCRTPSSCAAPSALSRVGEQRAPRHLGRHPVQLLCQGLLSRGRHNRLHVPARDNSAACGVSSDRRPPLTAACLASVAAATAAAGSGRASPGAAR
jgi:hypothetical protein